MVELETRDVRGSREGEELWMRGKDKDGMRDPSRVRSAFGARV